jgi:hypothetical protein
MTRWWLLTGVLVIVPACPALHPWAWWTWAIMSVLIVILLLYVRSQESRLEDLSERITNVEMMRRRNLRP